MIKIKVTKEMYNGEMDLSIENPEIINTNINVDNKLMERIKYGGIETPSSWGGGWDIDPEYFKFFENNKLYYFDQLYKKIHFIFEFEGNNLIKIIYNSGMYGKCHNEMINIAKREINFFEKSSYYPYNWIRENNISDWDVISYFKKSNNEAERKLGEKLLREKNKEIEEIKERKIAEKRVYQDNEDKRIKIPITKEMNYCEERNKKIKTKKLTLYLWLTSKQYKRLTYGYYPVEMCDPLFVYFENNTLYCHEFVSGDFLFKAKIFENNPKINIEYAFKIFFRKDDPEENIKHQIIQILKYISNIPCYPYCTQWGDKIYDEEAVKKDFKELIKRSKERKKYKKINQ